MSLSSSDLCDAMMASVDKKTAGTEAMDALGKAISDYLNSNNEVTFAWSGYLPPPASTKDPATSCKGSITGVAIALTQSKKTSASEAQSALSKDIIAGVEKATYTTDSASGFLCSSGPIKGAGKLSTLSLSITGPSMKEAYTQMASQIVDWFKSIKPTTALAGTHGSYAGTATFTSVS